MVFTNELKREINRLQNDRCIFVRVNEEDYIIEHIDRDSGRLEDESNWAYVLIIRKAEGLGIKR